MVDYTLTRVEVAGPQCTLERSAESLAGRTSATQITPRPSIDQSTLLATLGDGADAEFMAVLISLFQEDATVRLAQVRRAMEQEDAAALRQAAHGLKGGAASIGAIQMAALCRDLEELASAGSVSGASELLSCLESEFERVRVELEYA